MASSTGQFSVTSEIDDHMDWRVPLAKLNSSVIKEVEDAKEEINQLLLSGSKQYHAVFVDLFNVYVRTSCKAAGEILLDQSQQSHFLFEKMNESLKYPEKRYSTLMLLWNIIQRQPSWLHTIISTGFFNSFIKCLKVDNDVVILMTGMLIITSLLPSVPSLVGSLLVDFYDIFERIFIFTSRKRGITPETHLLHLKAGVYIFFHRLYAMYPNNTVAFMKSFYESNLGKDVHRSIELLLRWVKFHPWLITETEQTEIGKSRWRCKEPHDVVIDCEKVSLEPSSCQLQESETLSSVCTLRHSSYEVTTSESSGILTNSDNSVQQTEDERLDMATQTGTSLQNAMYDKDEHSCDSGTDMCNSTPLVSSSAMFNSPTTLCSLSTPPSSKNTSPSGSVLDVSLGHTTPQPPYLTPHQDGSEARLTPTPLNQPRRSSLNHHTANSFAVIDDSSTCGRSTPPIILSPRSSPANKKRSNASTVSEMKKSDKKDKDNLSFDLVVDDNRTEQSKTETTVRTPTEKCTMSKIPWDDLLETLQPFTTNICRHCLGNPASSSKRDADWESHLSPAQLLDHYLMFGNSLQRRKLNSIPLTSQEGNEWTHFGGTPPLDEVKLLRKELLLLQSELLFERHKCDLHATRNRRLVGKVFQANTVREELSSMKDQMNMVQKEVASLEQSCKEKIEENRIFKEKTETLNLQQAEMISNLKATSETLTTEKLQLEGEVEEFRSKNKELQEDLKESKAKIFQLENDLSFLRSLEKENTFLKSQADMQAKNLLIMGEREEQLQDLLRVLRTTVEKSPQVEAKIKIYQKELDDTRALVSEQKAELMFFRSHVSDIENGLVKKEHEIKDLKKSMESIKKIWKDKLDAVESKYHTIKRTNQRLESEVMSLRSKLDARIKDRDR